MIEYLPDSLSMVELRLLEKLKVEVRKRIENNDHAHDYDHIMRVYKNAEKIAKKEGANIQIILASALLHDIISHPKSDPRSKNSSIESAKEAKKILRKYRYSEQEIKIISDAIRDHSYSRGVVPKTKEGKILQDADRLDAIGAIGIARAFSVGGTERRHLYNNEDPFCATRTPDDTRWTLDHFYKKLLLLEKKMNTQAGKKEAQARIQIMKRFLFQLEKEI